MDLLLIPLFAQIHLLWRLLPFGYLLSVGLKLPLLWFGLSPRHDQRQRIFCTFWLTACTLPVVILVLPPIVGALVPNTQTQWTVFRISAIVLIPAIECILFWYLTRPGDKNSVVPTTTWLRDIGIIVVANLLAFVIGYLLLQDSTIIRLVDPTLPENQPIIIPPAPVNPVVGS